MLTAAGVLAGISVIGGLGVAVERVQAAGNYSFAYVDESAALQTSYLQGETLRIPEGMFTGEDDLKAETFVRFPSGIVVLREEITLQNVGEYEVVYRAKKGNETIEESKKFVVQLEKYTVDKNSASIEYVENVALKDGVVEGLKVKLPQGAKFTSNRVFNLNEYPSAENLLHGYIFAETQGIYGAKAVTFRFTDLYDAENYFDVVVDAAYDDGNGSGMSYYRTGAHNQTTSGWGGNTNEKDYDGIDDNDPNKQAENRLHVGDYGAWAGALQWSVAENLSTTQAVAFSMDYKTKEVYGQGVYPGKIIADLDSVEDFGQNTWNGFTTGECTLSVFASNYNATAVTLLFTQLGDETTQMRDNVFVDTQPPVISLDMQGVEEKALPEAVVGCAYPVFTATAKDAYCGSASLDVSVIYNKSGSSRKNVSIIDGHFTPDRTGVYTIVYTAKDAFGLTQVKEINVPCNLSATELEISLSQSEGSALTGTYVTLPQATVVGAHGTYSVTVKAILNGEEGIIEGNQFRPMQAGAYTVSYTAKDFTGQTATANYALLVNVSDKPVFMDEVVMPRYMIGGYEHKLPILPAYDFHKNGAAVDTEIWIKEGDNAERKIDGNFFTPALSDSPYDLTVTYLAKTVTGEERKSYTVPCYSYKVGEGAEKNKMFVVDEGITADYASLRGSTQYAYFFTSGTQGESKSIEFVNAVYANGFASNFSLLAESANYKKLNVYLTDAVDSSLQIKVSYFLDGEGVRVAINDGTQYATSYEQSDLSLQFDNQDSAFLLDGGSSKYAVTTTLQGLPFSGFTSKKVYVTYEMEGIEGNAGLVVNSINGQNLTNSTSERSLVEAEVVLNGSYTSRAALNTTMKILSGVCMQVSAPYATATVTVRSPQGEVLIASDGTRLEGVSIDEEYAILLSEYGSYEVEYAIVGSEDVTSYFITVVDGVAPEIAYKTMPKQSYSLGETMQIAAIGVDNLTDSENMEVIFVMETPAGLCKYLGADSVEYRFRKVGTYRVRAFTSDEYGNYGYHVTTIEVTE